MSNKIKTVQLPYIGKTRNYSRIWQLNVFYFYLTFSAVLLETFLGRKV